MKRFFAMLLTAAMIFAVAGCETEGLVTSSEDRDMSVPYGTITWGTSTDVNNDMLDGWSNLAPNSAIKTLIHYGNSAIARDSGSNFFTNEVVCKSMTTTDNEDGSKTYTIEIYDDLVWNDGTPITAKDYCFSALFRSSKEFGDCGANNLVGYDLVGYTEFSAGENPVFAGVRLIDEYTFALIIAPDKLPYYWDILNADLDPYPMHVIAPGVDIIDDGEGCYFTEGFTYELLEETLLNPTTGYRFFPQVTSGPYKLVSYDAGNRVAVLERNMLFKGTYEGLQPNIQRIIVKYVDSAVQVNALEAGECDMLTGLGGIVYLEPSFELVERGLVNYHDYPRNGGGYLRIHCDQGPTQFVNVRQAMIYLIDRDEFVRQYAGGYAISVDSQYSESMYIYQENKEWLEDNLIHYTFNPDKATELLEEDGWTLNASGQTFTPGTDTLRYKMVDGELMPLKIEWLSSDNIVAQILRVMWIPAAAEVGMEITETKVTSVLDAASRNNIRDEDAEYFVFNMGSTWTSGIIGFWNSYSIDPAYWGGNYNTNFIIDEELDGYVNAMKYCTPGDKETYDANYLKALERINYLVPDMWLYSDQYHDFYIPNLKNFNSNPLWGFGYAIQRAYLD